MTPPLGCTMALLSFIILSVHGQLSVIWNGTVITDPVLIYLDEILVDHYSNATLGDLQRPGALVCQSGNSSLVSWHFTDGVIVSRAPINQSRGFIQTRTGEGVIPGAARLSTSSADAPMNTGDQFNGVWHCRLNAQGKTAHDQQVNVDIFSRGGGRGTIRFSADYNPITLGFSSFTSSSPTFTLYADTIGGPPTNYNWTRNGEVITQGGPYSISIAVNGFSNGVYSESLYRSTLRVTGLQAGVYTYSVTNRATNTILTSNFTIEEATPPTDVRVVQIGLLSVLVSWTAPSPPPIMGYLVTAEPGGISVVATLTETSKSIIVEEAGAYEVNVTSRSQHFPSNEVRSVVTINDTTAPIVTISSINAASAMVSWTQPQYSFSPVSFTVMLTRIIGTQQTLCADVTDTRTSVNITASTLSMELTSLHEYSTYNVTVTALFSVFNTSVLSPKSSLFHTSKAAPAGAPQEFNFSTTSTSATMSWSVVECIEQNGEITGYRVELQDQSGVTILEEVINQTFTASGLTPHKNYTFRVAARNSEGMGPFSDITTITTQQYVPGPVSNLGVELVLTSIVLCWSAPQEPNGDIIAYEVTYSVNESYTISENTSDISTTLTVEVFLDTNGSQISVRAYTPIGPGNVTEFDVTEIDESALTRTMCSITSATTASAPESTNSFSEHTGKPTLASTDAAQDRPTLASTDAAQDRPTLASTDAAQDRPTLASTDAAQDRPTLASTDAAQDRPTLASTDAAQDRPTLASTDAAQDRPTLTSTDAAQDRPTLTSTDAAQDGSFQMWLIILFAAVTTILIIVVAALSVGLLRNNKICKRKANVQVYLHSSEGAKEAQPDADPEYETINDVTSTNAPPNSDEPNTSQNMAYAAFGSTLVTCANNSAYAVLDKPTDSPNEVSPAAFSYMKSQGQA